MGVCSRRIERGWASTRTRVVELRGRVVIPGINDAHLHQPWSADKQNLEIPDKATIDDVALVAGATKRLPAGTLIHASIPIDLAAPGMLADLAVLSQDIFTVPAPELPKTEADLTIIGGKVVRAAFSLVRPLSSEPMQERATPALHGSAHPA